MGNNQIDIKPSELKTGALRLASARDFANSINASIASALANVPVGYNDLSLNSVISKISDMERTLSETAIKFEQADNRIDSILLQTVPGFTGIVSKENGFNKKGLFNGANFGVNHTNASLNTSPLNEQLGGDAKGVFFENDIINEYRTPSTEFKRGNIKSQDQPANKNSNNLLNKIKAYDAEYQKIYKHNHYVFKPSDRLSMAGNSKKNGLYAETLSGEVDVRIPKNINTLITDALSGSKIGGQANASLANVGANYGRFKVYEKVGTAQAVLQVKSGFNASAKAAFVDYGAGMGPFNTDVKCGYGEAVFKANYHMVKAGAKLDAAKAEGEVKIGLPFTEKSLVIGGDAAWGSLGVEASIGTESELDVGLGLGLGVKLKIE
ncbi:hypothetical protein JOD45_000156 [Scopulibacillus daqui]|uniref:WXG100 family type VII secretion target n=1 Tax=Scopulibacillus daqui TaxID=1469162 RepID=A0ABS2PWN1_9BACL|nr:hypothetical protein [Scopulibacillus daqui]MBM7643965.1 hypothetical protein [Scopulibacillus daqui]